MLPIGVGTVEPGPLGVTPVDITFVEENVDGADMTCVCRRGNLKAYFNNKITLEIHKMVYRVNDKIIPGAALVAAGIVHSLRY